VAASGITGTTLASNVTGSSLTSFGTDPTANTQAVDNNSTKIATTAFVVGQAGSATPIVDGTATVGISTRFARQDHVHPTDTSRASAASPTLSGTVTLSGLSTGVVHAGSGGALTSSTIVDADINASAAIAATKVAGTAYTLTNRTADQYAPSAGLDIMPRMFASGTRLFGSGSVYVTTFTPLVDTVVTNIITYCTTGGTDTGGTTTRRMGLFTVDRTNTQVTLVARTASDATLWNTTGATYSRALSTTGGYPATYTLTAGTTYAVGVIAYNTGGTFGAPTIVGNAGLSTLINGLSPFIAGIVATQTDLPTAAATLTTVTANGPFARLT